MSTLNDVQITNGQTSDVSQLNKLLGGIFRSEFYNAENLSATRVLLDADMPIQRFNCNGADRIVKTPTGSTSTNHPYFLVNATSSGTYKLTVQDNAGAITYIALNPSEYVLMLPDGNAGYVPVGKPFWNVVTPSQITSNQDNYNPSGAGNADVLRVNTDSSRDITGFGFPAAYKTILVVNSGSTPAVFKNESASSVAANRFSFGADLTLATLQAVMMWYDPTSSRWRVVGGGSGGGGGLTVVVAAVTGSNVTVEENKHYILNLAGLTGDRDFPLPTPSAVGVKVKMTVSAGDDTYHLLLKVNSVEVERAFITNETIEFTSYGTGAGDWAISQNDLIKQHGMMERQTTQSISNATATKVQLATAVINVGNICDTTNYRITPRRDKNYEISLFGSMGGVFEDQEFLEIEAYVNGVLKKFYASHTSTASSNRYQSPSLTFKMPLAAGDDVDLYIFHNEGAAQNTDTGYYPQLAVLEV